MFAVIELKAVERLPLFMYINKTNFFNKKTSAFWAKVFKIFISEGYWFFKDGFGWIKAGFHRDKYFSKG